MHFRFLFLLFLYLLPAGFCKAQQDSLPRRTDSAAVSGENDQFNKLQQLSIERMADSFKRLELENKVAALTEGNKQERDRLLQELNAIKSRDSIRNLKQRREIDSLRHFVQGFAVAPFNDTLFRIYTRQGSFLPKDRAEAIGKRLQGLGHEYLFHPDSLKLCPSEQTFDLIYKDKLIVSVSEQDAMWYNTSTEVLARQWRQKIVTAINSYQAATSWQTLLKEGLLALLVILIVIGLIYGINKLYRLLLYKLVTRKTWFNKGIKINNYELLNAKQQLQFIRWVFIVIKWLMIIFTIYLAFPVLFGIFPYTREISDTLISYVLSPLRKIGAGIWNYIPNLITIIVVVVIFRYVLKFLNYFKKEVAEGRLVIPGFYQDWAQPTYQIVRVLVLAFMLVVIFPYMPGSDSGIFKGVSVFIGVLFTLGSAGALGNVVAGLVLTYMRAFKLGDRVKIGDITGDIIGRSLLVTRVKTIQNEVISIPNSTVMNNHTTNYSSEALEAGLIVHTTVTIGYDVPWRQVHQLLIDAALDTDMIQKSPTPYVFQTSLDDYYVSYRINAYTREPNRQAVIYSQLHANIQDHFNRAGVEIMSPHYKALRDGNRTTIPNDYLDKDYTPPPFTVQQNKATGEEPQGKE